MIDMNKDKQDIEDFLGDEELMDDEIVSDYIWEDMKKCNPDLED